MKRIAPALIFWLLGVVNLFHPALLSLKSGDIGDTRLNLYFLEHQFKVLTDSHYPGSYATAPFWFPESENNMARSDLLTGAQPFYFLPRLFLSRDAAYQMFFVIAGTLNFAALFWILRLLEVRPLVAGLAAWVFAFGMHKVQHTVHAQLYVEFWGVLSLFCMILFLKSPAKTPAFWAVLLLGLQTLTSPYSGIFYVMGAALLVVLYMAIEPGTAGKALLWCRNEFFAAVGMIATALVPVAILLAPYWKTGAFRQNSWDEVRASIPTAQSWVEPLQGTFWWFLQLLVGSTVKGYGSYFIGAGCMFLAVGCGVAFLFQPDWRKNVRSRVALTFLTMSIGLMLLSSSFWGYTLWSFVYRIFPGVSGIRVVARISIVVNFGLIVSGALFLDYAITRWRKPASRFVVASCIALVLAENCLLLALAPADMWRKWDTHRRFSFYNKLFGMYAYPRAWYAAQSAEIAALIRDASAAYIYQDPSIPDFAHEDNAQLVGQQVDVPVMNGSTASGKVGYEIRMTPRKVLEKGAAFDFNGFAYLVPRSEEGRMQEDIRQAGLSFVRSGQYFSLYTPYGRERGYDADLQILGASPVKLRLNEEALVPVLVTNRSRYPWQPFGKNPTEPYCQVLARDTEEHIRDWPATPISKVVFPGESDIVRVHVKGMDKPGSYIFRLAMVQEGIAMFGPKDRLHPTQFSVTVE